jgi:hypothetical protein
LKKIIFIGIAVIFIQSVYSKDTPPYGENLFMLGFPGFISNAASTAGGGLYDAGPYSININPALTAPLQRVSADIGSTILGKDGDTGFAFLLGALLPSRWGVWTASTQGAFLDTPLSPPGNAFSGRFGWSRDFTENLYLGASVFAGVISNYGVGGAGGLDIGVVYRMGSLGFLKDARLAAAFVNVGKTFDNDYYKNFPGAFTPKGGFAAILFENNSFAAGFSADLSFPTFQNAVLNAGLELGIIKMITISFGWDVNIKELVDDKDNIHTPFIGISFKWTANTGSSDIMRGQGWEKTDVDISALYQQINNNINLFSAGVSAQFGSIDREPPVIKLGDSES